MSKIAFAFALFFLFAFVPTWGQAPAAESGKKEWSPELRELFAQLKEAPGDEEKMELYIALSDAYEFENLDSSEWYAKQAVAFFRQKNKQAKLAEARDQLALVFLNKGDMGQAKPLIEKNLAYAKAHDDMEMEILSLTKIGRIEAESGNFDGAAEHFLTLLEVEKEKGDMAGIGNAYNNLGLVFYLQNLKPKALDYHLLATEAREKAGAPGPIIASYLNTAGIYMNLDSTEASLIYLRKADSLGQASGFTRYNATLYGHLGNQYSKIGDHEKAYSFHQKKQALIKDSGNLDALASNAYNLGQTCFDLGKYSEGKAYIFKGIRLYKESGVDISNYVNHYYWLAKNEAALGETDSAFAHLMFYIDRAELDALNERAAIVAEMEAEYQNKEKAAQIQLKDAQLSRQKIILWASILVAGLLGFLAYMAYRNSRRKADVNKKLQALDSAKSRFFANISHELRTPLTLIIAPLENAIERVKSKTAKADLQTAHRNGKKLLTLVNEILDLSKLESGKMAMQESPVHLEKLLRRIFFSYHSLAQLRNFILSFSYHLPEDLTVKLDVAKFEKVVNNLLSNAFKYSQVGGVITLRAGQENGHLKIEVSDTGKGIPKAELEKIFERFYQAENENEPLQGGTGIGLAYAKEIALFFGGSLTVDSEVGKGSTFTFTLPLKKAEASILPDEIKVHEEADMEENFDVSSLLSNEKPHILIVEDNPEMSRFLVQSLSPHFFCTTAMDGEAALKYLHDCQLPTANCRLPDLITSDVMMPNMDGFTLLEKIHGLDNHRKTPFILLTARAMEEDKIRGLSLGVDDYLTKPFSIKELIARIHNLLKNKQIRELTSNVKDDDGLHEAPTPNHEEDLLMRAEALVVEHLSDGGYRVADLAKDLAYSPRQLERILKKLIGLPPVAFMREIRLQKAYQLLESRQFATVAEVRYAVGMENASHFTKKFRERFGVNPGEVRGNV